VRESESSLQALLSTDSKGGWKGFWRGDSILGRKLGMGSRRCLGRENDQAKTQYNQKKGGGEREIGSKSVAGGGKVRSPDVGPKTSRTELSLKERPQEKGGSERTEGTIWVKVCQKIKPLILGGL